MDAVAPGLVAAGGDYAAAAHAPDDEGFALQAAVAETFDRDEEGIQIQVEYCPVVDHGAVFWNQHPTFIKRMWDRYGELHEQTHGSNLARGDKRMLVVSTRIEDTHEEAIRTARNGHDEFWKFLGPYGWSRGYMGPDGKPVGPGLIPTLEESVENRYAVLVDTGSPWPANCRPPRCGRRASRSGGAPSTASCIS